jgi:hypothetical protein
MVCLPLVDVKFNFAVLLVKLGFLRANLVWGSQVRSRACAIPQLFGAILQSSRRL